MGRFRMVRAAVRERPALGTLAGVYGTFKLVEEGAWIAMTILAHARGGVAEASAVIVAQLVPAMLVALWVGRLLRRRGARTVLVGGLALVAVIELVIGAMVAGGAPSVPVYGAAALAASVIATIRPAVASLLPWLVRRPRTLTTGTVLLGWVSGVATLAGPAVVAVLLGLAGASVPFFVFGAGALVASRLALRLPDDPIEPDAPHPPVRDTLARLLRDRGPRGAIAVVAVYSFVIGAMDVAVVMVAVDALGAGDQVAGWFGTAVGGGTLLGTVASVLLVGRQWLWPGAVVAAGITAAGLAGLAVAGMVPAAAVAFVVVGAGMAALGVVGKALLQRLTPVDLLGDAASVQEATATLAILSGAAAIPLLVTVFGTSLAPIGVVLVLVGAMAALTPGLVAAERDTEAAVWKIHALGATPVCAHLPVGAIEGLANAAEQVAFAAGDVLMHQGAPGDRFHLITSGMVEIDKLGTIVAHCGPGDGVGELALLNDAPRNATVRAVEPVTTLAVDRTPFLRAVTR